MKSTVTKQDVQRMVALALCVGPGADAIADEIPSDIWKHLHGMRYLTLTTFGVPGADLETDITPDGRNQLVRVLKELRDE